MNSILTTTLTAAALALSLSALSAGPALADCGQPHGGIQNLEEGPYCSEPGSHNQALDQPRKFTTTIEPAIDLEPDAIW